jgi:hypothetical protein
MNNKDVAKSGNMDEFLKGIGKIKTVMLGGVLKYLLLWIIDYDDYSGYY